MTKKSWGAPNDHKDGVTVAKEIDLPIRSRTSARRWCARWRARPRRRGDGTTTATVLAQADLREGAKLVAAGNERDGPEARHSTRQWAVLARASPSRLRRTRLERGDRPSARSPRTATRRSGTARRGDGEGRQGRRDHRGRGQGDRDHASTCRRHADRSRATSRPLIS